LQNITTGAVTASPSTKWPAATVEPRFTSAAKTPNWQRTYVKRPASIQTTAERSEEARGGVNKFAASAFDEVRPTADDDVLDVETVAISTAGGAGILACLLLADRNVCPTF
jgi:hypothetical protein